MGTESDLRFLLVQALESYNSSLEESYLDLKANLTTIVNQDKYVNLNDGDCDNSTKFMFDAFITKCVLISQIYKSTSTDQTGYDMLVELFDDMTPTSLNANSMLSPKVNENYINLKNNLDLRGQDTTSWVIPEMMFDLKMNFREPLFKATCERTQIVNIINEITGDDKGLPNNYKTSEQWDLPISIFNLLYDLKTATFGLESAIKIQLEHAKNTDGDSSWEKYGGEDVIYSFNNTERDPLESRDVFTNALNYYQNSLIPQKEANDSMFNKESF